MSFWDDDNNYVSSLMHWPRPPRSTWSMTYNSPEPSLNRLIIKFTDRFYGTQRVNNYQMNKLKFMSLILMIHGNLSNRASPLVGTILVWLIKVFYCLFKVLPIMDPAMITNIFYDNFWTSKTWLIKAINLLLSLLVSEKRCVSFVLLTKFVEKLSDMNFFLVRHWKSDVKFLESDVIFGGLKWSWGIWPGA